MSVPGSGSGADPVTTRGTYAPRPGSAPLARMVLTHGLMEARLTLRNGEQILLALVIPLVLLIAGTWARVIELGPGRRVDILVPGVMALAIMSTSFTSLAISTGFERRYGVLKRLGASPLSRLGLLLGKALGVLAIEVLQLVVIGVVGAPLGWSFDPAASGGSGVLGILGVVAFCLVGTAAFSALGLLMAGTLRAEATLAAANLVYLVLLVGGAVLLPVARYPELLRPVIGWLPSAALAEGLRGATGAGPFSWSALGILALWAVVASVAASRTFRWD